MPKFAVTPEREIQITLTKQEAARLSEEMDDLAKVIHATYIVPNGSPFMQIRTKLVDAMFQSMRETDHVGPVE